MVQVTLLAAIAVPHDLVKLDAAVLTLICNLFPEFSEAELNVTVAVGDPVVEAEIFVTLKVTEDVTDTVACSAPRLCVNTSSKDNKAMQMDLNLRDNSIMVYSLPRSADSILLA